MALDFAAEVIPLATDADGVVRIGGTRVTLDTLVAAFDDGAMADEIVHQYPALQLADVYAVITYYLRQRPEVEAYLRQRRQQASDIRQQNEIRFAPYVNAVPVLLRDAEELRLYLVGCGGTGSWLTPDIARLAVEYRTRWRHTR